MVPDPRGVFIYACRPSVGFAGPAAACRRKSRVRGPRLEANCRFPGASRMGHEGKRASADVLTAAAALPQPAASRGNQYLVLSADDKQSQNKRAMIYLHFIIWPHPPVPLFLTLSTLLAVATRRNMIEKRTQKKFNATDA